MGLPGLVVCEGETEAATVAGALGCTSSPPPERVALGGLPWKRSRGRGSLVVAGLRAFASHCSLPGAPETGYGLLRGTERKDAPRRDRATIFSNRCWEGKNDERKADTGEASAFDDKDIPT